ncbi:MAG TPA: exodeoxyribonuclease VII small subunit [Gemmatimonadales bacterium]|nr:exodeoxyribonuclease VII small subunit [Gemmatimonadales bacterium]HSC58122.1 exodeoxyribonuclease VII small subunit [Gemmatimonadales bacterium]
MPRKAADPAAETPSLQDELRRLEEIVRELEGQELDLDRAIALFEEGVGRLRVAREQLAAVETRVQKVLEDATGELRLVDLD